MAVLIAAVAVFGITLGVPSSLPECEKMPGIASAPSLDFGYKPVQAIVCHDAPSRIPGEAWDSETIRFPLDALPKGAAHGTVEAMLLDGKVAGLKFWTSGVESQDYVLGLLTDKFGKPDDVLRKPVQNMAGASFQDITAIWVKPEARVTFLGTVGRLDTGMVTIDTPNGAKLREAEALRRAAKSTAL
jgi:hypothetical protein